MANKIVNISVIYWKLAVPKTKQKQQRIISIFIAKPWSLSHFRRIYRPALKKFYHWMEGLYFKLLMRKISRRFCFILIFILKRNVWRGLIWLNFVKEKKKALSAIAHRLLLLILFQAFFPHFVLFFRHKFAILYTIMTCGLICALY